MKRCLPVILVLSTINTNLFAAEAGMPQLDPKYWASQGFWLILVFSILYISIAKFYLPKIKKNLDDRESKIKEDLDEANKMKILSEKKLEEYNIIIEKEIEDQIANAQKEILELKKSSLNSINNISQEISSNIIEKMSGDKLNESSIKAVVEEVSKRNIGKYL